MLPSNMNKMAERDMKLLRKRAKPGHTWLKNRNGYLPVSSPVVTNIGKYQIASLRRNSSQDNVCQDFLHQSEPPEQEYHGFQG